MTPNSIKVFDNSIFWQEHVRDNTRDPAQKARANAAIEKLMAERRERVRYDEERALDRVLRERGAPGYAKLAPRVFASAEAGDLHAKALREIKTLMPAEAAGLCSVFSVANHSTAPTSAPNACRSTPGLRSAPAVSAASGAPIACAALEPTTWCARCSTATGTSSPAKRSRSCARTFTPSTRSRRASR